ncbi:hypothetical protein ROZALSC1DRAFT_30507 [Rozella allomycis CSF55]|uniref:DUF2470 domain-containing protein n=1 Tax=Rozella allomycis (strain CSF55) TaxID=988480 RepID=A0A4V1IZD9_ROZAC|nr:hypothetical protein ROZALSC1DRAFT_30507 [Rozella allomycis CSF55]
MRSQLRHQPTRLSVYPKTTVIAFNGEVNQDIEPKSNVIIRSIKKTFKSCLPRKDLKTKKVEYGVISVHIQHLSQFFNSFDPSPFHERDMDSNAEEFILTYADEIALDKKIEKYKVEIVLGELPDRNEYDFIVLGAELARKSKRPVSPYARYEITSPGAGEIDKMKAILSDDLQLAINNHFDFQSQKADNELKKLFRTGRTSLIAGVIILVVCLLGSEFLTSTYSEADGNITLSSAKTWAQMGQNALQILAWVSLWRPLEIFLFNWFPLLQHRKLLRKLSQCDAVVKLASETKRD